MLRDIAKLIIGIPFVYVVISFFGTMMYGFECIFLKAIHVDPPAYVMQIIGILDTIIFGWMTITYIARWCGWK